MASGALTAMVLNLDQATVLLTAPTIAESLNADLAGTQWMFTGFLLPLAAFVIVGGGLTDRFGVLLALRAGLGIFLAGTIASAFATSIEMLIGMRVVAGLGASLAFPASVSLLRAFLPSGPQSSLALGLWFSGALGGSAIGPLIGGLLLRNWPWWSVFVLSAACAAMALLPVVLVIEGGPQSNPDAKLRMAPSLGGALGLALVAWGLINAGSDGWLAATALLPILLGLAAMAAIGLFLRFQRTPPASSVESGESGVAGADGADGVDGVDGVDRRRLVSGLGIMLLAILPVVGTMFFVLTYLQRVFDFSVLLAGAAFMPFGVTAALVAPFSVRMLEKFGPVRMLAAAVVLEAAGLVVLSRVGPAASYLLVGLSLVLVGAAMAVFPSVSLHMVLNSVPRQRSGLATAAHTVALQIGQLLSIGVMGSLVASMVGGVYRSQLEEVGLGSEVSSEFVADLALGISAAPSGALPSEVSTYQQIGEQAFMSSVGRSTLLLLVVIAGISACAALTSLRKKSPADA